MSDHTSPRTEDGTGGSASGSLPSPRQRCVYVSLAGDRCGATVVAVRPDGRVDVDVDDRKDKPLSLTRLQWWTGNPADCPKRACMADWRPQQGG